MHRGSDAVNIVEGALALGFRLPEAIGRALGRPVAQVAANHGFSRSEASMCLNGYPSREIPDLRDAFAEELGIDREVVDRWIERWSAVRDRRKAAAA